MEPSPKIKEKDNRLSEIGLRQGNMPRSRPETIEAPEEILGTVEILVKVS